MVSTLPEIVDSSDLSMASSSPIKSPSPPSVSKYLMNDIPRGTSLLKIIKCLQPPGYDQSSPGSTLHDVQVGVIIQDSRLDDELSVATIKFHDNPKWLSQNTFSFPKFTPLGTLWRAIDWNAVDEHGRTEFIRAVMKLEGGSRVGLCYAEMLAEFTETDVNVQDDEGRTALHWACVLSHAGMVMLCLSVPECRIGLKDNDGLTAFDISLRTSGGNEAIPSMFYQSMLDMEEIEPQTALLRALTITSERAGDKPVFPGAAMFAPIEASNEPLVEALINRGVDLTATNEHGDTALHVAAAKVDNVAITARLLVAGSDVNAIGNHGATALHYAVDTADVGMVELLLQHNADRSATDHNQRTALDIAENDQKQDLVLLLKDAMTDSSEDYRPDIVFLDVQSPLNMMDQKQECVVPLTGETTNSGVVIDQPAFGKHLPTTPLSAIEMMKVRQFSLHEAARNGNMGIVRLYLRLGVDLEAKDTARRTPLHCAALGRHTEIVRLLLAGGAEIESVSECEYTALHHAAQAGYDEVVQLMLDSGANIHALTEAKETALHKAVWNGHIESTQTILSRGVNIEAVSKSGETALHKAAKNGSIQIINALITSGANLEALCLLMETPLQKALQRKDVAAIKALRAAGAHSSPADQYQYAKVRMSGTWK